YYVNEMIPQGQGPVILRDDDLTTTSLADAPLDVGDSLAIPGTGITISVLAGTGGADYNIQLSYTPPATDYNVRITRGDTINGNFYSYFSPDIWIDSPRNGFNLAGGPPAHADRDNPVIGEVNRIYARIWNDGPATAFDFDVRFRISEPYHTVGGEADFDTFIGIAHVNSLAANASTNVYVEWTPANDGSSHACLLVDVINLVGTDTNPNDHEAQENLDKVTSVTASPYHPVTYRFDLTNPYDEPALFYFRVEGAPHDWSVVLSPRKILLNPGQRVAGTAVVTPPPDAKLCTSEFLQITSWTPRGDTLINVGGAVVQVDLRRSTTLTLDAGLVPCDRGDWKELLERLRRRGDAPDQERAALKGLIRERLGDDASDDELEVAIQLLYGEAADRGEFIAASKVLRDWQLLLVNRHEEPEQPGEPDMKDIIRDCGRITAAGCTNPRLPNQEIIVKFTDPLGNVEYQTVMTDENGCFETFMVTVDDGIWQVEAEYAGDDCGAPARTRPHTVCKCRCDCKDQDKPR
ncbi:MAG: CARDB domain-containing protein, partial [Sedimenticolaceae bacterium]